MISQVCPVCQLLHRRCTPDAVEAYLWVRRLAFAMQFPFKYEMRTYTLGPEPVSHYEVCA